jgi:hypothetical protein
MSKIILASIAALGLAASPAFAQSTVGGGASASGPQGSVAGGATAGSAAKPNKPQQRQGMNREERQEARQEQRSNSASTYGSGTVYTDRNRATGGVTAGGTATGTDRQSTSTSINAYGSTTRDGSDAEVYGDSTATSGR